MGKGEFESRQSPLPEEESVSTGMHTEVWNNLITAQGSRVNDEGQESIISEFALNDSLNLVFFIGAPEQGKTAVMNQFGKELVRRTNGRRTFAIETMEASFPASEAELGPKVDWLRVHWRRNNEIMAQRIRTRLQNLSSGQVLLVETPSVGGIEIGTDRGVSALVELTEQFPTQSMTLAIVGDPKIERFAQKLRTSLSAFNGEYEIPDKKVIQFLKERGQLISGLDKYDRSEAGKMVRKAFLAMDSGGQSINPDQQAAIEQFLKLQRGGQLPEGPDRLPEIVEMRIMARRLLQQRDQAAPFPVLPEQTVEDYFRFMELSVYFHRILFPQLGNPTSRSRVLFNTYLKGTPIHYLTKEYLEALQ